MDPVTHALIGAAVSAAGQDTFALTNPITISVIAGALIPDGDIVLRFWGGSFYLKHHRGVSHSLIGIGVEAAAIGLIVKFFLPGVSLLSLILWAFIGALTHIISDVLNSYGAKIFWPLSNKKRSLSLLTITDPVILILLAVSILSSYNNLGYGGFVTIAFIVYISSKVVMRIYGKAMLIKKFSSRYMIKKIHLLPSMIANYKFHYIVEAPLHKIVGEINFISNKVRVFNIFDTIDYLANEFVLKSKTAAYFKEFTPIFHVGLERLNKGYKVLMTDLRYILNSQFLHHATIIYDEKMNIIEEKFNPYNITTKLDI